MILVTGANGMMGGYVPQVFENEPMVLAGRDQFDVCDPVAGERIFAEHRPRLVIHLAAETDVDYCEKYPDQAFRTTYVGAQVVGMLCAKHNATLAYISTTGIFDGRKPGLYDEFDHPNPVTVYGKTKWESERLLVQLCPRSYVIRAGWVFGGGKARDKKFVGKMIQLLTEKEEVNVVSDKVGSPTYALDFLRTVRELLGTGLFGTYHAVNQGACTRYDIALEIKRLLGLKTKISPCSSAMFPLPAFRPPNDSARNFKLQLLGMDRMRPWKEALEEYVSDWIDNRDTKENLAEVTA